MFEWINGSNKGDINKVLIVKQKFTTRTNGFKLDKFRFRKEISKNWFTNMVVKEWNKLSKHVVNVRTLDIFKKRLYTYMDEENR